MSDCIFCSIASGDIKADVVYEDQRIIAFNDINKQAPVHIVIIPKQHTPTILDVEEDSTIINDIVIASKKIAEKEGISESGFRLVNNCNEHGGQTVFHLHFHLLGGRNMTWPPG